MEDKKKKKTKQSDELEKLKKELEDYKTKYLRALADYQNLEKRVIDERESIVKRATENIILKVLPFLDNLDKAELFIKDEGLKMIKSQFFQILREEGIEDIELVGKEFDPQVAEAVEIVEGEKDNIITEVLQKGYRLNGKLLRHAKVKVTKKL